MADYKLYTFEEIADALADIRKQHEEKGPKDLIWNGPDHLHHSVSATSPPPSSAFSNDGLAYHAERDRDFWEVYTMVAIQLGIHQGAMIRQERIDELEKSNLYWREKILKSVR